MRLETSIFLLFLFTTSSYSSEVLLFARTGDGKTTITNALCSTNYPTGNSVTSVTIEITSVPCGEGFSVIDTVGVFNYQDGMRPEDIILKPQLQLLNYLSTHELAGIRSPNCGPKRGQNIRGTHRHCEKPGPWYDSLLRAHKSLGQLCLSYPQAFAAKYGNLPVYDFYLNGDNRRLLEQLKSYKQNYAVKLPANWETSLRQSDLFSLKTEVIRLTGEVCQEVIKHREFLRTEVSKLNEGLLAGTNCNGCNRDCFRRQKYCESKVFGMCVNHAHHEWYDAGCRADESKCKLDCAANYRAELNKAIDALQSQLVSEKDDAMLNSCAKFQAQTPKEL